MIAGDPKSRKQPATTVRPLRRGTRPASIIKPIEATAMIAIVMPTVPSSSPSIHWIDAPMTLVVGASESEAGETKVFPNLQVITGRRRCSTIAQLSR